MHAQVYSDTGKREVQTLRTAYLDISSKIAQLKQVVLPQRVPGAPSGPQDWRRSVAYQ